MAVREKGALLARAEGMETVSYPRSQCPGARFGATSLAGECWTGRTLLKQMKLYYNAIQPLHGLSTNYVDPHLVRGALLWSPRYPNAPGRGANRMLVNLGRWPLPVCGL